MSLYLGSGEKLKIYLSGGRRIAWQMAKINGGIVVTDDGSGNVTITAGEPASIVDDGNGNVIITTGGSASVIDDGYGNVTIL